MKNLLNINVVLISCIFFFLSCKKNEIRIEEEKEIDNRDLFVGTYSVYDTTSNYLYAITIEKRSGMEDSLVIKNFANKFAEVSYVHEKYWDNGLLDYGVYHPIYDYYGKRWHLSSGYINKLSNVLKNDTIRLHFKLSNIAFYYEDSVSYVECNPCKHIAVKKK